MFTAREMRSQNKLWNYLTVDAVSINESRLLMIMSFSMQTSFHTLISLAVTGKRYLTMEHENWLERIIGWGVLIIFCWEQVLIIGSITDLHHSSKSGYMYTNSYRQA